MKILIISDTHRHNKNLEVLLGKVAPLDLVIHLGDFEGTEDDVKAMAGCPVEMIAGNNDFYSLSPKELITYIGKFKVLLTHGHLYNVSYSLKSLIAEANAKEVDIVMFGHTHRPLITRDRNLVILNPGSLSYPRQEGRTPTYIIMEIDDKNVAHYTLNYLKY